MTDKKDFKWYIATTIIGSEQSICNSLYEKIKAYDFDDHIDNMLILNYKDIKVEFFDNNNPPPKSMKNSKYIQWFALDDGRYKKVTTKIINKYPGYIFIDMKMTDEIWYIIRNTPGITGFIGSSGKGAKPIPISEFEIEDIMSQINEEVVTYINAKPSDKNSDVSQVEIKSQEKITTNNTSKQEDDFYDSKTEKQEEITTQDEKNDEPEITHEDVFNNTVDISEFKVGHSVRLLVGAFKDEVATIKSIDEVQGIIEVEVDLFGRSNLIQLKPNEIEKLN